MKNRSGFAPIVVREPVNKSHRRLRPPKWREYGDFDPMPFGKWKGKRLLDVPAWYLLWLHGSRLKEGKLRNYLENALPALKKECPRIRRVYV